MKQACDVAVTLASILQKGFIANLMQMCFRDTRKCSHEIVQGNRAITSNEIEH